MDNLAHTLTGALMGQAGLKKKTGLGMATLTIAANLPDIDAVTMFLERGPLFFRRGWTHGPIALVALPLLLALAVYGFDRWQARRGTQPASRAPLHLPWLVVLAALGIASHLALDFVNDYGIRLLMPFSERWFYGDALLTFDIWVWTMLGYGLWSSLRRDERNAGWAGGPALAALTAVTFYAGAMITVSAGTRSFVAREIGDSARAVVATPVALNPLHRRVVVDMGDSYVFGDVRWSPSPRLALDPNAVAMNMMDSAVDRATSAARVADFLAWSRLPFAAVERNGGALRVTIGDARYNRRPGDGPVYVRAILPE